MKELNATKIELATNLVNHYIYQLENPDWGRLMIDLMNEGFTSKEVYVIMNKVREEGVV